MKILSKWVAARLRRSEKLQTRSRQHKFRKLLTERLDQRMCMAINVAVVGTGTSLADSGYHEIVEQLNDDSYADFNATFVTGSQVDTVAKLSAYDAVVIGDSGYDDDVFNNTAFTSALRTWTEAGGGVIMTGWGIRAAGFETGPVITDIDAIIPVNTAGTYGGGHTVAVRGIDHPVTNGIPTFGLTAHIEAPRNPGDFDPGAITLADVSGNPAVVIGSVGQGRGVYLGPTYAGATSLYAAHGEWRSGYADRLLEQAVKWAASDSAPPSNVVAWGYNGYGDLGDGTYSNRYSPVGLVGPSDVIAVDGDYGTHLELSADGTVWAAGDNYAGQLGDGTPGTRPSLRQVPGVTNIIAIAKGDNHSVALKDDGTVWTWGANGAGELGLGDYNSRSAPTKVPGLTNVTAISAGASHTVALLADGTVHAWGYNAESELGSTSFGYRMPVPVTVPGLANVVSINAGGYHNLALLGDGSVKGWGYNVYGQVGPGGSIQPTPTTISGLAGVVALDASDENHSLALMSNGTVRAWGANQYGQLGDGTTQSRSTPVQVSGLSGVTAISGGRWHSAAVLSDGTLRVWGNNSYGQLGDRSSTSRTTPIPVSGIANAVSVEAGGISTFVMRRTLNQPPTLSANHSNIVAAEGQPAANHGTFADAQGNSSVALTASIGSLTKDNATGTWTWSLDTTDGPAAPVTVTVTATDDLGEAAEVTFTYQVDNVAPTIAISGPSQVQEDSVYNLSLGAVSDPGVDSVTSYIVHWGDGSSSTYSSGGNKTHVYADNNDSYAITVDLIDEDGTFVDRANALNVAVQNVAPVLKISGNTSVNEGSTYTLNLSSSDPGTDTINGWSINWGDGSPLTMVAGNPPSVTHVYADGPRNYTILATATDEDGTYEALATGGNAQISLDPSFGVNGEVREDFFGSSSDQVRQLVLRQADGKILVAGTATGGNSNIGLARYNFDGTPDATFGSGGKALTEFGSQEYVESMAVDSLGRIIVGGGFGLARYSADGVLDTGFGINGKLSLVTGIADLAIDSQDRIVVSTGSYLTRVNANGAIDPSFNNGMQIYFGGNFYGRTLTVGSGDSLIVGGYYYGSSNTDFRAGRFTSSGQLDASFGVGGSDGNGWVTIDYGGRDDYVNDVAVHGTGILLLGYTYPVYNSSLQQYQDPSGNNRLDGDLALVRLLPDGTLDTGFFTSSIAGAGKGQSHFGSWEEGYALHVTPSQQILVGGNNFWARYNAAGVLDTSINATQGFPGRANSYVSNVWGISVDSSGRILTGGNRGVGGGQGSNFAVARQLPNGNLDNSFGVGGLDGDGIVTTDFEGSTADVIQELTFAQPDGKILVAGYKSGGIQELVLIRYMPDGSRDTSFGNGGVVIDGNLNSPTGLAVDSQGRVVVLASNQLARYNANGTPDNSFGASPAHNREPLGNQLNWANELKLNANGDIVVGGYRYRVSNGSLSTYDIAVARYHGSSGTGFTAGSVDTSFGTGGSTYLDLDSGNNQESHEFAQDIEIDASGRIVVFGYSYRYDRTSQQTVRTNDFLVARFLSNGGLDTGFGVGSSTNTGGSAIIENTDGVVLTDFGGSEDAQTGALDNQGRIVAGSWNYLARYTDTGSLDSSFDGDGKRTGVYVTSMQIDNQDRIVSTSSGYLQRTLVNGAPDTSFAPNGMLYIPRRYYSQLTIDAAGRILVAGQTDSEGASGTDFSAARYLTGGLSVNVQNVAPQNVTLTAPSTASEGDTVSLSGSATDPAGSADPLTYTWTITRNGLPFLQTTGSNLNLTFPDNGNYNVVMTVDDGDGGVVTRSKAITVANIKPVPSIDTVSSTRQEGSAINVTASATDVAGANDTLSYNFSVLKNGSLYASGSGTSTSFTPNDNGSYEIILTVSDEDGGSATTSRTITVDNVAPEAVFAGVASVTYGQTATMSFSQQTDDSSVDIQNGFHYAYSLTGDFTGVTYNNSDTAGATKDFSDLDAGTYWVFARIIDKDNGFSEYSLQLVVNKAVASISVNGYAGIYDGYAHGATGTATGVNGEDLSALFDLGDSFVNVPGGTANWTFNGGDNYTTVSDSATITIDKAASSVTATGDSFVYDGTVHTGGSAVVSGPGIVTGSAVLTYSGDQVNAGTYTVIATYAGDANHLPSSDSATITIDKAASSVSATGDSFVYDGTVHTGGSAVVSGPGIVTGSAVLSYSGDQVNAGTYTVIATYAGDANHLPSSDSATITIDKADAAIIVNGFYGIYDGNAHGATGSATGVQGESLAGLALGDSFTHAPGGTTTWTFTDVTGNYNDANGEVDIVISRRAVTVVADNQSKIYGAPDPALTYRIESGSLAASDDFFGNLAREAGESVGTYAIGQGDLGLSSDYDLSFVQGQLAIQRAALSGNATTQDALNMAKQGKLNITVSGISGFVNGENANVFLSNASFWITVNEAKFEFVPSAATQLSASSILISYTLKNSSLQADLADALLSATSAATAIKAGFAMESMNYSLSDDYLARLFSTVK